MLDARPRNRASSAGFSPALATLEPRLRLFGLLALLIPLFAGLLYLVHQSTPHVEVRVVTPDVPAAEQAQAPAERVVERVVYVPIERAETAPVNEAPSGLPEVTGRAVDGVSKPRLGGLDSSNAPLVQAAPEAPEPEPAAPDEASSAAPADEPIAHMGLVAMVTPVAAPPVPVAAAPVRAAPAQVFVAAAAPVEEEEVVADADEAMADEPVVDESVVAEAESPGADEAPVAQVQVIDTTIEADRSTHVVVYRIPVEPAPEAGSENAEEAAPVAADDEAAAAPAQDVPAADVAPGADEQADDPAPAEQPAEADAEPAPDLSMLATSPNGTVFEVDPGQ